MCISLSLYIYIYICICMYMYMCVYIYIYICVHIYAYEHSSVRSVEREARADAPYLKTPSPREASPSLRGALPGRARRPLQ